MIVQQLIDLLGQGQHDDFFRSLPRVLPELSLEERQELLEDIMDGYYDPKLSAPIKEAFDLIMGTDLDLNYHIYHVVPTFMTLVILRAPYTELFDYFIGKGADINYLGDVTALAYPDDLKSSRLKEFGAQYVTCLDYVLLQLEDMLADHKITELPEQAYKFGANPTGTIRISRKDYEKLYDNATRHNKLLETKKLRDYLVAKGGKRYEELREVRK